MGEKPLPRSVKRTVYRLALAQRGNQPAKTRHIVRVLEVCIGNDMHGQPVWSRYPDKAALCGTSASFIAGEPGTATHGPCLAAHHRRHDP